MADPTLSSIPVVVLSTSVEESDVVGDYGLHANSYVAKPVDFDDFVETVRSIESYWLTTVRLPEPLPSDEPERARGWLRPTTPSIGRPVRPGPRRPASGSAR